MTPVRPESKSESARSRPSPDAADTLHFVYSFACNLLCDHCLYRCGPGEGPSMTLERAASFLEQAARAGVRRVVFNGGEPTLHRGELLTLIALARGRSLSATLMTNASWASSRRQAERFLPALSEAGLDSLTLSTDRFHLLRVPLDFVIHALEAARELGIRTGVKIARLARDPIADGLDRHLRPLADRVVLQQVSPLGRGSSLRESLPLKALRDLTKPGCLTPPVLLPDGSLLTCCNLPARDMRPEDYPFILGNLEHTPLGKLLELRARHPLLAALRHRGPAALFAPASAAARSGGRPCRSLFHDGCDLCFHLSGPARRRQARAHTRAPGRQVPARDRPQIECGPADLRFPPHPLTPGLQVPATARKPKGEEQRATREPDSPP